MTASRATLAPPTRWAGALGPADLAARWAGAAEAFFTWVAADRAGMAAEIAALLDPGVIGPVPAKWRGAGAALWLGAWLCGDAAMPDLPLRAVPDGAETWRPPVEGEKAAACLAVPVLEADLSVSEILAVSRRDPAKWRWRTGTVPILGEVAVDLAHQDEGVLELVEQPLDWVRRGDPSRAACVLDWNSWEAEALLDSDLVLVADSERFAAFLDKRIRARRAARVRPKVKYLDRAEAA